MGQTVHVPTDNEVASTPDQAQATQAGRAKLVNGTSPDPIALPEADVSDMEYYIDQARIVLPVLGINLLRTTGRVVVTATPAMVPPPRRRRRYSSWT